MELKIENGRYVPAASGGLSSVSGVYELMQRVIMRLSARRGEFLPLPDYGSLLHTLSKFKPSQQKTAAKQFVCQALANEPGLSVDDINLYFQNDGSLYLTVYLSAQGQHFNVSLTEVI